MTHINWLRWLFASLATAGLLFPPGVRASTEEETPQFIVHDVRLDPGGGLHVVVVDAQGHVLPKTKITLTHSDGQPSIQGTTNVEGRYTFRSLTGGSYSLRTSEGVCMCRVWTNRAAPPKAADQLLIVNDRFVQRGQRPIREMFHSDPILMTAIAVAAIAIPVAIHKSRDDSPPGS